MEKKTMSKEFKDIEVRYCKKCGCELVSANRRKICENCRRERANNIKRGAAGGVTLAGSIFMFIAKNGIPSSKK